MQSRYEAGFSREMGSTEAEWLRLLPAAIGEHVWRQMGSSVTVSLPSGELSLNWQVLEPRVMGLAKFPRLLVTFRFDQSNEEERFAFMRRFDLYTHRGGG